MHVFRYFCLSTFSFEFVCVHFVATMWMHFDISNTHAIHALTNLEKGCTSKRRSISFDRNTIDANSNKKQFVWFNWKVIASGLNFLAISIFDEFYQIMALCVSFFALLVSKNYWSLNNNWTKYPNIFNKNNSAPNTCRMEYSIAVKDVPTVLRNVCVNTKIVILKKNVTVFEDQTEETCKLCMWFIFIWLEKIPRRNFDLMKRKRMRKEQIEAYLICWCFSALLIETISINKCPPSHTDMRACQKQDQVAPLTSSKFSLTTAKLNKAE